MLCRITTPHRCPEMARVNQHFEVIIILFYFCQWVLVYNFLNKIMLAAGRPMCYMTNNFLYVWTGKDQKDHHVKI